MFSAWNLIAIEYRILARIKRQTVNQQGIGIEEVNANKVSGMQNVVSISLQIWRGC